MESKKGKKHRKGGERRDNTENIELKSSPQGGLRGEGDAKAQSQPYKKYQPQPKTEGHSQRQLEEQQGAWGRGRPQKEQEKEQRDTDRGPHPEQQGAWVRGVPQKHREEQIGTGGRDQPQVDKGDQKNQTSKSEELKGSRERNLFSGEARIPFAKKIVSKNKEGRRILVETNFFPLKLASAKIVVYHYDVVMVPDTPKFMLRSAWYKYSSEQFPKRITVFDGRKNAFSKGPLIEKDSHSATVTLPNENNGKEREFNVKIQVVRKIDMSPLGDYKAMLEKSVHLPEAEITILDLILRNGPVNSLVQCGRTFFPKKISHERELSDRLALRLGHFQSAFLGSQIYLNFDVASKPFYRSRKLIELIDSFWDSHGKKLDLDNLNDFVKGMTVRYKLPGSGEDESRTYRVIKLVGNAIEQTFKKEDGSSFTVLDYLKNEKNCTLERPDLPLLWVGATQKNIYVPIEFCTIAEDQVYRGEMSPTETREMVRNVTCDARRRRENTMNAFRKVDYNNAFMREFGLSVSGEMAKVNARIIDPPVLRTTTPVNVRDGVWRIRNFSDPKSVEKWCILNLDKYARKENLDNLQRLLREKGTELNMRIGNPVKSTIAGDASPFGLKKTLSQLKQMDLVFVIIPETKGLYSRLKTICETQEGILTQCIRGRTINQDFRKLSTTIENILLKVNAKLGGKNHVLESRSVPEVLKGYVMVVGADVTHSGPGSRIPSVAAVAVSCDVSNFQYGISTRVQRKEIIEDLEKIMSFHLKNFRSVRGRYPEKIIFFRDGVSEGELPILISTELRAVQRACSSISGCDPKITLVVVQKRHHVRLYPTSPQDETGKNSNVPVGTCVDTDVVHPRDVDFYLLSHASILGTARPTRYRLLYDENRLTDEELEKLSFYLCHLYSRCNRSVSYPSPTYNAHLAAFRIRSYLEFYNLTKKDDLEEIQKKLTDNISKSYPMFFV